MLEKLVKVDVFKEEKLASTTAGRLLMYASTEDMVAFVLGTSSGVASYNLAEYQIHITVLN